MVMLSCPPALISVDGAGAVFTVKSAEVLLVPTPVPEPEVVNVRVPVEVVKPVVMVRMEDAPQEIEVGLKEEEALLCRFETDNPVTGPENPPEQLAEIV